MDSYINGLAALDVGPGKLRQLARHSSISTTLRYIRVADSDQLVATRCLEGRPATKSSAQKPHTDHEATAAQRAKEAQPEREYLY